jgi:F-type H+-transporting ATPase subunit a
MMEASPALFFVGPFGVSASVVTTWGIMLALALASLLATRTLGEHPGKLQTVLEGVVMAIESSIAALYPRQPRVLLPFIGTLWLFLIVANLAGIVPGLHSPTGELSLTAALALLVFLSVHWYGVRAAGWRAYLRHYFSPSPLLFPFHVMSELSRTVALAIRLFGNMASLEMAALLVLLVAGFLVPVPILLLHVVEALVQAYIFGMLALVYIASGIEAQKLPLQTKETTETRT